MKLIGKLSGAAALMLALAGCISSEYTGREYPSIETRNVTFYQALKDVPETKLVRIGRCVVSSPDNYSGEALKQAAIKKAAEVGADAVAVYDFKKIDTGEVTLPVAGSTDGDMPSGRWAAMGRTADDSPIYTDSFGDTGSLKTSSQPVYELRLRLIFFRDRNKEQKMPIVVKAKQVEPDKKADASAKK